MKNTTIPKLSSILVYALAFTFFLPAANATIHTVNNQVTVGFDFVQISTAVNSPSVLDGDTLYVHGSSLNYNPVTLNKRLHIFGPGYFLSPSENNIYETNSDPASVGSFVINSGAEHSIIEGLRLFGQLSIQCDDISIRKNFFSNSGITLSTSVDSCFIYNNFFDANGGFISYNAINSSQTGTYSNIFIVNNIMRGGVLIYDSGNLNNQLFLHNTMLNGPGTHQISGVTASFNIFADPDGFNASNSNHPPIFIENIFAAATSTIPAQAQNPADNNVGGVDMAQVFSNTSATPADFAYTNLLAAPNPATTNCVAGGGCGATFGSTPHYRLSGIPEIPILYNLTSDSFPDGNGNLNVTIKARSY